MKFRDIRTKLAALGPGRQPRNGSKTHSSNYPDIDNIVLKTQPQTESTLMQVPQEIRNLIFSKLWNDAGLAQHILFENGSYTSSKCVTDHSAPDDLMEQCARYQTSRFENKALWQRMVSAWGNHWECEEFYQSRKSKGTSWNPFLTMMLVCKQMYIECRACIYGTLTFVIHDIETLYNLTISRRLPIINDIKYLNLAIRLPIRRESKQKMSREAHATMSRWHDCCRALNGAQSLSMVDMWLDTSDPVWRGELSSVPEGNANPFVFGGRLAGMLTVDLPINPARPEAWRQIASIEPKFSVRPRGWPVFRADTESTTTVPNTIIKLWASAEPGVPQPALVFGTRYGDPGHRRR